MLYTTNRLADAEPLMRRVVDIFEQAYGAEHPKVASGLNNLAQLLQDTDRLAEAEPLMRRALGIDEQSYGVDHPRVAIELNNLAQLLQATNRLAAAETLTRRSVAVCREFGLRTGYEHPRMQAILPNYRELLQSMQLPSDEIDQREQSAMDAAGPMKPIVPEVERLLGPAKSTQEVFETLDRQYREQHKPEIWFLPLSQPIAPHLDELLGPLPAKEKE